MQTKYALQKTVSFFFILLIVTLLIYSKALDFGFTNLDDQEQVVLNNNIKNLSFTNIKAIFSSSTVGMYTPISTTFYSITYSIGELNPRNFHALSLLFHFLNCFLVFKLFKSFNYSFNTTVLITTLFAVHPMQVESIAWVSAYSNLCFTSFLLLSFLSYQKYVGYTKTKYYLLSILFFILAGLAKSTAVILPILLIAFDFIIRKDYSTKSILNKTPFLIISVILGLVTIFSRESAGHLSDLSVNFSWFDRFFLIAHSILFYPIKFLIPSNLSAFYAYPDIVDGTLPIQFYLSPFVLLTLAFLVWKFKPHKSILFGIAFYLIGIALVLQFVPVGNQLTTDRYIYLPMLGFLLIIGHLLSKIKNQRLIYVFGLIPLILALLSFNRSKVWENDKTIWTDVISKNPNIAQAYNNLGSYVLNEKNPTLAMKHFNKAIELKSYYADAYSNRGSLHSDLGNSKMAFQDLHQAIKLRPHADAYYNRANEFVKAKDLNSAIADYTESIKLKPSPDAYTNRAFVFAQMRETNKAMQDLNKALKINPKYGQAYFLKGMIFNGEGNKNNACKELNKAARLNHEKAKQAIKQLCR